MAEDQIPISQLPSATTYTGLVTIATDANNRSVKVPLAAVTNPPKIGQNGNWYIWSLSSGGYVDSGITSKGNPFTFADFTAEQLESLKVNGEDGRGVLSTDFEYGVTDDGNVMPTEWDSSLPAVQSGQWLWFKAIFTFTDNTTATSYLRIKQVKSAYDYAREGGYTGTEQEFISLLGGLDATDKHVFLTEDAYEELAVKDPEKIYMTYEDE